MAVGMAGEPAERDLLSVAIGGHVIAAAGGLVEGYDETPVVAHMKGQEIDIAVDLGLGVGADTVYTCDLTHGYIDINGAYRS
jgi:glutamate N-acetyltransferase/amino-acid N-acetyltransferase